MALAKPARPKSVYLDANAFIHLVENRESRLGMLFDMANDARLKLYTSEWTLSEVLVIPLRLNRPDLVEHYEAILQSGDALTVWPVDRSILRDGAGVRATLGNKGPDAIHVATALKCDCTVFVSSDARLKLPPQLRQLSLDEAETHEAWL